MMAKVNIATIFKLSVLGFFAQLSICSGVGQVSPDEMVNSQVKAAERRYLGELVSLHRAIDASKFPMKFRLARYIEATSGRAALDANGIEFVDFQGRLVLKISGVYGAAFDSGKLDENDRATRTFIGAVVPMLRTLAMHLPRAVNCDGIGFEVLYDIRSPSQQFDVEGREVLSLVVSRDDAFAIGDATDERAWQAILDRSEVYVSGKPVVLRLDSEQPPREVIAAARVVTTPKKMASFAIGHASALKADRAENGSAPADPKAGEATRLQEQFGAQARAVMDAESEKLHPEPSSVPQFESEADQVRLHFTVRNVIAFEGSSSSIYKRAARSFDLFLAPELRSVVKRLPPITSLDAYHFSVLNTVSGPHDTAEVIDYICPVDATRAFVNDQITSQQLIDKSTVLVNGVRIGINLQVVE